VGSAKAESNHRRFAYNHRRCAPTTSKTAPAAGTLTGLATQPEDAPAPAADAAAVETPSKSPGAVYLALAGDAELASAPVPARDPLTHSPRLLMLCKEIAR